MSITKQLTDSYSNGFVDCNLSSLERYNPKLLVNNYKKNIKVLTSIENELKRCKAFYFSVAFITESGIAALISTLKELEEKGITGKIITSQYQNFTQPKALRKLLKFKNIELRIVADDNANFHAKGYIFEHEETYSLIIGSSNITQNALCKNQEWNIKLSSLEEGSVMQSVLKEFDYTFKNATVVDEKWISAYEKIYSEIKKVENDSRNLIPFAKINPNKMQKEALFALEHLRKNGKQKALLISATGTGKTFLSAFDVKMYNPKRFLFIVHRENIARRSMESFKKIMGANIDASVLIGAEKNFDSQYTFTTIQTLSRENVYTKFNKNHFDYIVIDEVHRSGAATYKKILDHFSPDFLLGMTATPERTDGYDVFETFDYNIAYEIRLNRALEENMLVPFHYYGVADIEVNGRLLEDKSDFNALTSDERVARIMGAAELYGYDGERLKGLIFCSRKEEAKVLSEKLNQEGLVTVALDGGSNEGEREGAIKKLEKGELQYIISVDIFNEGVDIPSVNQIIMLRPTQSAIVFVQQLGRGLRKNQEKEYLTVIDFIGNYANNYLLPIALYGDRSFNKDTLRKLINAGSSTLPGASTVHFDKITKERIYAAIDDTNLSTLAKLRKTYELMKYQLGRTPSMIDFLELGEREPYMFCEYVKGSYFKFLKKVDEKSIESLSEKEERLLDFYAREVLNGKRIEEVFILGVALVKDAFPVKEIKTMVKKDFGYEPSLETIKSAIQNLNGEFIEKDAAKKYGVVKNLDLTNDTIRMDKNYRETLLGDCHKYLNDNILYAQKRYKVDFSEEQFRDGFLLYKKYSRKDVCRILNWEKNEDATIFGYRIKYNTCPIFVTYNKKEDITESTKYEDEFMNPFSFNWMTRNRVTLESSETISIANQEVHHLRIPLFIKKSDGEGKDFYYMGDLKFENAKQVEIKSDKGKPLPIVNIKFKLQDEVEESLYNYITTCL